MIEEIESKDSKNIQMYQVVIGFVMLLIVFIGAVIGINGRITALEIKQSSDDEFRKEVKEYFDELRVGQTEILIKLENKENRSDRK
jgi:hypothetical protein